jgi:hypothetical protein
MRDEYTKLNTLKNVDFRIGERLYTFRTFDEGCKAIAIHARFIGYQNDLEQKMRDEGLVFSHSFLEYPNCQCNICQSYHPSSLPINNQK